MSPSGETAASTLKEASGETDALPRGVNAPAGWTQHWRRRAGRLLGFVVGQGLVQIFSLFTGILVIRWLSVADYAVYSLVNGFQGAACMLVEVGLGTSIVALLAGRTEKEIVGGYIRSARHYRKLFFLILAPGISIAFGVLSSRHGWSGPLIALLLGSILTTLYFDSWSAYYSAPLLLHQELGAYYRIPAITGASRLVASFALYAVAALTSWTAVWVNSLAVVGQGWLYRQRAARHIVEPAASDPALNRQVRSYIQPLIPGVVFYAVQGQITILLISWFGQTRNIAEVGALGRLGQLFLMLGAFNSVIIAPNIAKIPRSQLLRRYCQFLIGAVSVSLALMSVSLFAPELLLWILGSKYMNLQAELGWMMAAACVGYLTGVMWTMHAARKWIFTWGSWAYIVAVVLTQAIGIALTDLSSTRNVIRLSFWVAVAAILAQVAVAGYGFFVFEGGEAGRNGDPD